MQVLSLGQKIPWSRQWQPIPAFLPGKFHGQRSLAGYSAWGRKEPDPTEHEPTPLHPKVIDIFPHRQQVSNSVLSHVGIQLSQHLLLKRLFISQLSTLVKCLFSIIVCHAIIGTNQAKIFSMFIEIQIYLGLLHLYFLNPATLYWHLVGRGQGCCQTSSNTRDSSVQSLSRVRLFATPRITERQASLSITNSPPGVHSDSHPSSQ